MNPRALRLTDNYRDLLARTGEDFAWPPIEFVPGHEGGEHVEFNEDGSWTMIVTDRGQEYRRRNYTDRHDLMFNLCAGATWEDALAQVREPGLDARMMERRTQARQVELMGRIDPEWARRIERNYRNWRRVQARMDAAMRSRTPGLRTARDAASRFARLLRDRGSGNSAEWEWAQIPPLFRAVGTVSPARRKVLGGWRRERD